MKIEVFLQKDFWPEKQYIINLILQDFLGFDVVFHQHEKPAYVLKLENGANVIITDYFFSSITKETYLHKQYLPTSISYLKHALCEKEDLPVLFGRPSIIKEKNNFYCEVDIFASSFFMLTRWEEYVQNERDIHNRFPDKLTLAYKNNFHKRPIVDEYVELLWNMLFSLDNSLQKNKKEYSLYITHDIDDFRRYDKLLKYFKALLGDVLNRKNPFLWLKTTSDFVNSYFYNQNDPYDTFDYLMKISEQNNLISHFYFIPGILGEYDVRYDIKDKKIADEINRILKRGHSVGIHGSYKSADNATMFQEELQRLRNVASITVKEGRQHYLRFIPAKTWRIWADSGMCYDSTVGFSSFSGFRAGTAKSYAVFDILDRKKLSLVEQPLIAMDVAVKQEAHSMESFYNEFVTLSEIIKHYGGQFTILWHNNNFNTKEWREYAVCYEDIIHYCK